MVRVLKAYIQLSFESKEQKRARKTRNLDLRFFFICIEFEFLVVVVVVVSTLATADNITTDHFLAIGNSSLLFATGDV